MSVWLEALKCNDKGCPWVIWRPQLETGWGSPWQCVYTILLSGSNWILTAAHCLHHSLDPEDPILHDFYLLSPSDFKIIVGEWGASWFLKPVVVLGIGCVHSIIYQDRIPGMKNQLGTESKDLSLSSRQWFPGQGPWASHWSLGLSFTMGK